MDAQQIVNAALKAASAVTAVTGQRIYPEKIPQDAALPAIAVKVTAGGAIGGNVLANTATVDVLCDAHAEADMHAAVEAIQATLEEYNGTADSTHLRSLHRTSYVDNYDNDYNVWSAILTFQGILIGA
jgi:hypothetical protein